VKADVEAAAKGGAATAEAEAPPKEEAPPQEEAAAAPAAEPEEAPKQDVPAPVISGDKQAGRGETTEQDLTRLQKTVARRMAESKATAPDFVLTVEVDMEEAVALRKQLKAAAGDQPAPSFNDFVIKASALALRDFPRANGAYRDGKFELYSRVNVGMAVAGRTRSSSRPCSTPTRSRSATSPASRARSPSASAPARSPRRSSRAARSRSPTSACSASSASSR
jgi:pyruvate dehydrogenase E2 component (dihydrolipoamide acetyltransferase)